jgi:hypothetical protein
MAATSRRELARCLAMSFDLYNVWPSAGRQSRNQAYPATMRMVSQYARAARNRLGAPAVLIACSAVAMAMT